MQFPEGFLWGTATAAHQIEGNNTNSDWWHWENSKKPGQKWPLEPSGIACDSYNRYEEDFDLCKRMNNNAVRISIEWARIEPKPGQFDQNEIQHYKKVLQSARDKGLKTFVTLHHFTSPYWFSKPGGWISFRSAKYFARYAEVCAKEFGDLTDFFLTINEAEVMVAAGYLAGMFYPTRHNPVAALLAEVNLHRAHNRAYTAMKKITNKPIGIVKNLTWCEVDPKSSMFLDKLLMKFVFWLHGDVPFWMVRGHMDIIGLNYYLTTRTGWFKLRNTNDRVSDLGWWIHPEGLEHILVYLKKYKLPIYITENGIADANDKYRKDFIREHLTSCWNAIQKGADLRGYMHWSLIDNFEWHQGYWPRFGLVEIDRENGLARKPRPSFHYYAEICKNNMVDETVQ